MGEDLAVAGKALFGASVGRVVVAVMKEGHHGSRKRERE